MTFRNSDTIQMNTMAYHGVCYESFFVKLKTKLYMFMLINSNHIIFYLTAL